MTAVPIKSSKVYILAIFTAKSTAMLLLILLLNFCYSYDSTANHSLLPLAVRAFDFWFSYSDWIIDTMWGVKPICDIVAHSFLDYTCALHDQVGSSTVHEPFRTPLTPPCGKKFISEKWNCPSLKVFAKFQLSSLTVFELWAVPNLH